MDQEIDKKIFKRRDKLNTKIRARINMKINLKFLASGVDPRRTEFEAGHKTYRSRKKMLGDHTLNIIKRNRGIKANKYQKSNLPAQGFSTFDHTNKVNCEFTK